MIQAVLQTNNLTKRYKSVAAVDGVNITVQKGDIYGLIGRNGAGKTTLMRLITALCIKDEGEIALFGKDSETELNKARKRIGAVIEAPALYPNLSAEQNLEYYRILKGIPDKSIIEKTLKTVDLCDTKSKKVKNFSLGMKQRLGIALALLGSPDFIILDEPINGLDPMGIVEMRDTFTRLNRELGITLMISSHILSELSIVATRYGIINDGKLIKELTSDELKEQCQNCLCIKTDNTAKAASVLETQLKTTKYKVIGQNEIRLYDFLDNPAEVMFVLNNNGVRVSSLNEIGDSLEDYFISLIEGGKHNV